MGISEDLAAFESRLRIAIRETLETDVADTVREEISTQLSQYDFPRSRSLRGISGGLTDQSQFEATVEEMGDTIVLRVEDVAKFQSGRSGSKTLAEVVTDGDEAYHMPKPRPFMGPAQKALDAGKAKTAFMDGIRKRGFGSDTGFFNFGG